MDPVSPLLEGQELKAKRRQKQDGGQDKEQGDDGERAKGKVGADKEEKGGGEGGNNVVEAGMQDADSMGEEGGGGEGHDEGRAGQVRAPVPQQERGPRSQLNKYLIEHGELEIAANNGPYNRSLIWSLAE